MSEPVYSVKEYVEEVFYAVGAPGTKHLRYRVLKDDKVVTIFNRNLGHVPLEFVDREIAQDLAAALNTARTSHALPPLLP